MPNYNGRTTPPVSSSPSVPAKRVGAFRDVVADHNKAVQAIYDKAVADAGPVIQDVSKAAQATESAPNGPGTESSPGTTQGCLLGVCAPGQDNRGFPVFPNPFQPLQDAAQDIADAIGTGLSNLWDRAWANLVIIGAVGKAIGDAIANAAAGDDPDESAREISDDLGELPVGDQPHVRTVGSEEELRNLYDKWSEGGTEITPKSYNGTLVQKPDGTIVGLRNASRSGGPAIDLKVNGKDMKVHLRGS